MTQTAPVSVDEAARLLGVTPEAIRKRIGRGTLAAVKGAGGRWYVSLPVATPDADRTPAQDTGQDAGQDRTGQPDAHGTPEPDAHRATPPLLPGTLADLAARLAASEADNTALRDQVRELQHRAAELSADRDAWRDQAQAVTQALQQQQALALPDRMRAMPAIEAQPGVWQRVKAFLTRKL